MTAPVILRGEVWLVTLDPTLGHEIRKTRPCLVVSPDAMNRYLGTVVVLPLTSGSRDAPFRIASEFAGVSGRLLGDQIRSVARQRLVKRIGVVDAEVLNAALGVLREMFAQ